MTRSIATRLAIMFAVGALVVFSIVGVALHRVLHRELERQGVDELHTRLEVTSHSIVRASLADRWEYTRTKLDALAPPEGSTRFWVLSADPRFRYGGDAPPELLAAARARTAGSTMIEHDGRILRALARSIPANGERPEVQFVVAVDAARFHDTLRTFAIALVVLVATGGALVGALGHRLAKMGLRPLGRLSDEAQALSPRNLSQRLRQSPLPRELSDLAASFNGALDRLERAYAQLEAFNADVAHELRTPLNNLVGETQVALAKPRTNSQLEEVLQSNLEELERLRGMVNDMLFLARADQGETARGRVLASAADEIAKTVEFLEILFDEAGVTVRVDGDAQASIETSLFRRAVSNLLINAVEHTGRGAEILVVVSREGAAGRLPPALRIAVINPGTPIPEPQLGRIFDRFYRADNARASANGNHGLGLSIVKAVAAMHGGAVFATSTDGKTTIGFTIAGPAA